MFASSLKQKSKMLSYGNELLSTVPTHQTCEPYPQVSGCRVMRTSPSSSNNVELCFAVLVRSNKPQSLHHSAANKMTQHKTTGLLVKETDGGIQPVSVQSACGEPKPKQSTQKPMRTSLTAERFLVLVDFRTCWDRLETGWKYFRCAKLRKIIGKSNH